MPRRPLIPVLAAALMAASVPGRAENPVFDQAAASASAGRSAAASAAPASASAAAREGFGETAGASGPVDLRSRAGRPQARAAARVAPVSGLYAAGAPPGPVYHDDDDGGGGGGPPPKNTWDRDGAIKAGAVAMGAALIGFLLGGPIGAAAGFLAGFFIGAALWHFGKL